MPLKLAGMDYTVHLTSFLHQSIQSLLLRGYCKISLSKRTRKPSNTQDRRMMYEAESDVTSFAESLYEVDTHEDRVHV